MENKILVLTAVFLLLLGGCRDTGVMVGNSESDLTTDLAKSADLLYGDLSLKDVFVEGMRISQDLNPQDDVEGAATQAAATGANTTNFNDDASGEVNSGDDLLVSIDYDAQKDYPDGIVFSLDLVPRSTDSSDNEQYWHIDSGSVLDILAGPSTLEIETFIPYEVPTGDYVLLGQVLEDRTEDPESYNIDEDLSIVKLPIRIVQPEFPDVEISDLTFSVDYMGMSAVPEFEEDGYTGEPNIMGYLDVYNGGSEERSFQLQLDWESNGQAGALSLYDPTDDTIGEALIITVPPTTEDPHTLPINALLSESDYEALLALAPNLENTPDASIPKLTVTAVLFDPDVNDEAEEDNYLSADLAFLIDNTEAMFYDEDIDGAVDGGDGVDIIPYSSRSMRPRGAVDYIKKSMVKLISGDSVGVEWDHTWGKKHRFAVEPKFEFKTNAGLLPWPQISSKAESVLNVYVFNSENALVKLTGEGVLSTASVGKSTGSSGKTKKRRYGGKVEFEFLGAKLIDEDNITKEDPKEVDKDAWAENTNRGGDEQRKEYLKKSSVSRTGTSIGKSWEVDREFIKTRFFIGGVPLSVAAGLKGSIEIEAKFEVSGVGLEVKALVPVKAAGFVRGGLDIFAAVAGVEGSVDVISAGIVGGARLGLDVWSETAIINNEDVNLTKFGFVIKTASFGGDADAGDVDLYDKSERESSKISAIRGNVGLFARAKVPKFCSKGRSWWKIYYPCGMKISGQRFYFNLYSSPWLFARHLPLYHWNVVKWEWFSIDPDFNLTINK